jgi:hypothetical protein
MSLRLLLLAASVMALSGSAVAADSGSGSDAAPVSTASQDTDHKIAAWLGDTSDTRQLPAAKSPSDEPIRYPDQGKPDRKIHGEVGAGVGSDGYRSAYGVATIPIGKSSSATIAVSTIHGRVPWVAGAPWSVGPAGAGISADCVCHEAPDGQQVCRVASAASPLDAQLAEGACLGAP